MTLSELIAELQRLQELASPYSPTNVLEVTSDSRAPLRAVTATVEPDQEALWDTLEGLCARDRKALKLLNQLRDHLDGEDDAL